MTPFGLFEFTRMPFGLKNAAQTFQRLMDPATQQLPGVFVYLDDVLVVSKSMEEHVKHLAGLFEALKKFGLTINKQKCEFGVSEIEFLGHKVTARGIYPLQKRVNGILQFARPHSIRALQRFLGMMNFYRRFVPKIASILIKIVGPPTPG